MAQETNLSSRKNAAQQQTATDPRHHPESSFTRRADDALGLVGEHAHEIDPVLAKRVVRKIDMFLMPVMFMIYGLVYYDKAILGSAAILGMRDDLHLSVTDTSTTPPTVDTSRLSWATSLFYFGMLAGLYPMTFLLQRFKLSHVLTPVIVIWGAVCMSTAGVTSFRGLYAQRFFLGFVEAVIPTCFSTIITGFYTQDEQALRQSWWWSSLGFWTIIGSAINYGFGQIQGGALARWQYIYLFAGSLTILFGLACFCMPDSPVTAWFLTAEERVVAVERLRASQTGVRCHVIKLPQIIEAFQDVKVLLVFIMMASAYTINGAISGFGPLIVTTFGYTPLESILLQFPLGGLCAISTLVTGYLASKIPNIRIMMLILCCLPVIAGCAMIWRSTWGHRPATPVAGYSITGTFGAVVGLVISVAMSNVAGATKKSFMAAALFVAYCVGNIVGPQLIKSQTKSRHYPELWLGLIICYCITIVASAALYALLRLENWRRDELLQEDKSEKEKVAFQDLTDKENSYFRYTL